MEVDIRLSGRWKYAEIIMEVDRHQAYTHIYMYIYPKDPHPQKQGFWGYKHIQTLVIEGSTPSKEVPRILRVAEKDHPLGAINVGPWFEEGFSSGRWVFHSSTRWAWKQGILFACTHETGRGQTPSAASSFTIHTAKNMYGTFSIFLCKCLLHCWFSRISWYFWGHLLLHLVQPVGNRRSSFQPKLTTEWPYNCTTDNTMQLIIANLLAMPMRGLLTCFPLLRPDHRNPAEHPKPHQQWIIFRVCWVPMPNRVH